MSVAAARRWWTRLLAVAALFAAGAACTDRGNPEGPAQSPTAAATAPVSPAATSTPEAFAARATTGRDAATMLERALGLESSDACPPALVTGWEAVCGEGDIDGDGTVDEAYLVALAGGEARAPNPGAALVRHGGTGRVELLPVDGEADHSQRGQAFFAVADRTGDQRPEVAFLTVQCGANDCLTTVRLIGWDSTAWRDVGAGEPIDNLDFAAFEGTGAASRLTTHGGTLNSVGAGPTRATRKVYTFRQGRYAEEMAIPDPAVYLIHAIIDADALFAAGKFLEAAAAYRGAVDDATLRDWKAEMGAAPGRPGLSGYALLRIAVAMAARGDDANQALDAVIRDSKDPLFVSAAEAFRKGLQESMGGVHQACVAVTAYLATPGVPEYVRDLFDYGFGNLRKTYTGICPL